MDSRGNEPPKTLPPKVALADETQTAEYIYDLVGQLERIARTQGLVKLAFLLGGCREEARRIAAGESLSA